LLRVEGYYAVSHLVPAGAVAAYYILFPDPWPKKRHHDHRLFNPPFIEALHRTLVPDGALHVATDHLPYFEEIYADILASGRFKETETFVPDEEEQTDFERYYVAHTSIGRASFVSTP
jgi:tRNA (guanine-N7-)-methyltransferase